MRTILKNKSVEKDLAIYTIGHSNHPFRSFIKLLVKHGIEVVADVRRYPVSRFVPHFNKRKLEKSLLKTSVDYIFIGNELGGYQEHSGVDTTLYLEKVKRLPDSLDAIERLIQIAGQRKTAIMCGEGDPARCHRQSVLAQILLEKNVAVLHILPDGSLSHAWSGRREEQFTLF